MAFLPIFIAAIGIFAIAHFGGVNAGFVSFTKPKPKISPNDLSDHPCRRHCQDSEKAPAMMTCVYDFKVAWYTTMSPSACLNCPTNVSQCDVRPGWIFGSGASQRPVLVANHVLPGPTIFACLGDKIRIRVSNMAQNGEMLAFNWGREEASFPKAPAISPGTTLTYRFKADLAGTYLWQSTNTLQRLDGLFGALIIRDPDDLQQTFYDSDDLQPLIFQDWFPNETALQHFSIATFGTNRKTAGQRQPLQRILVNGRWPGDGTVPPFTYNLDPKLRYRFRLINGAFRPIQIKITGHDMVVLSRNGRSLVKSVATRLLKLRPNERYDVVPLFTGGISKAKGYSIVVNADGNENVSFGRIAYAGNRNPSLPTSGRTVLREYPKPDPPANNSDLSGGLYGPQCGYGLTYPHTLCLPDSPQLINLELNSKSEILERHNYYRATVDPPAEFMPQLHWDEDLAVEAERWAAQCEFQHSSADSRSLPQRGPGKPAWNWVGQNLCWANFNQTWTDCINGWGAERRYWRYGVGRITPGATVGHYTQIIWADTLYVGCGKSHCHGMVGEEDFYLLVCHYGPGGNVATPASPNPYAEPYEQAKNAFE